jgi:citrate lyase subunit beta/citryl-CoA lyase
MPFAAGPLPDRSLLFVPGDRPDRFPKAESAGADAIVLDLEDAVDPGRRVQARQDVRAWLDAGHYAIVRINAARTEDFSRDLAALEGADVTVMVAKAESPGDVADALAALSPSSVAIPLIETPLGVRAVDRIATSPAVLRLAFGSIDLAAELGVDHRNRDALLLARSALVLASAAAGLQPPIDGVTLALEDPEPVSDDARYAAGLGFTGKLCVHPRQVEWVHRALRPSEADVRWASATVETARNDAAAAIGGQMVDRAVLERARRVLARDAVDR